jgi:hypothetical protein
MQGKAEFQGYVRQGKQSRLVRLGKERQGKADSLG